MLTTPKAAAAAELQRQRQRRPMWDGGAGWSEASPGLSRACGGGGQEMEEGREGWEWERGKRTQRRPSASCEGDGMAGGWGGRGQGSNSTSVAQHSITGESCVPSLKATPAHLQVPFCASGGQSARAIAIATRAG
jgi:hypothetical protein